MKLTKRKWIEDGQFMVEIKGSLSSDDQSLIQKYGDMRIDLTPFRAKKSFSELSDFSASGGFMNEEEANEFVGNLSQKLEEVLKAYRSLHKDFNDTEVIDVDGLEFRVKRELRNRNYVLHLTTHPNKRTKTLIEKYGDRDIDVSSEKSTAHTQSFTPQSPKISSLRIDKSFENALDAYHYRDKIKSQLANIVKDYSTRNDAFSGEEQVEI